MEMKLKFKYNSIYLFKQVSNFYNYTAVHNSDF